MNIVVEKIKFFAFLSIVSSLYLAISSSAQEQKFTAAVVDMEGREGISRGVILVLSDYLRTQLVNTQKFTIVTRENMEQILKEQNFQLSGCASQECIVQVGQLLGVRKIFTGTIGKVGATYIINLKIIDVQSGQIEKAETEECSKCEEDALLTSIKNISQKITGLPVLEEKRIMPESKQPAGEISGLKPLDTVVTFGSLFVDSFPVKGKVYLNEKYVGNTPFSSDRILAGAYNLKIISKNYKSFESFVQIPVGRKEEVFVKLNANSSERIGSPGYAYEAKLGIQIRGPEEDINFLSGGLALYFPYFRLSGSLSILCPFYFYPSDYKYQIPYKIEALINIPFDWWCFQFGFSYSHYEYSYSSYSLWYGNYYSSSRQEMFGFPVGFEFFVNSNLSFDFHIGPAYYRQYYKSTWEPYSSDYGYWAICGNLGGMNIYF